MKTFRVVLILLFICCILAAGIMVWGWGSDVHREWIDLKGYRGIVKKSTIMGSVINQDLEIESGCIYSIVMPEYSGIRIIHGMQAWSDINGELELVFRSLNGRLLCGGRGSITPFHAEGGGEKGNGRGLQENEMGIEILIQLTGANKANMKGFYVRPK